MTSSFERHERRKRVVSPRMLTDAIRRQRYFLDTFMDAPLCTIYGSLTEPTLTALEKNRLFTGRYNFEWSVVAVDHTAASQPTIGSEGGLNLVLSGSDVAGNGLEVNFGSSLAGHPRNCTPRVTGGGGEDWFVRVLLLIDDVSGCEIILGFRTTGAYVATLTEVLNHAGIRVLGDSSSALAAFSTTTNLANSSTTDYTSTALTNVLTDATLVELEVQSNAGYVRYFVNGVQVGPTTDQFALDQRVAPFLRALQQTDVAAEIKLLAAEGGPLDQRSEETLTALAGATT